MKVLFLSVPAGGGHHQTAKAMADFFAGRDNVETKILDVAENVNSVLKELISKGYILSTTLMPKAYSAIYDILDAKTAEDDELTRYNKLIADAFRRKLKKFIDEFRPDVIVSTHVWATIVLNRIARRTPLGAPIISIITDFTVHPFWEQTKSDFYIIPSEFLSYQAIKKLGDDEVILPMGIPIGPKFSQKIDKVSARRQQGLDDKFTVLVMMGSMGYGKAAQDIIKQLDKLPDDFQILAVCGRNKKLKNSILKMKLHKKIEVFGFVDNIDELMDASDCIITKPGGLSTSEALSKNLPLILANPIPGQEDRNLEFMLNHGVAVSLSDTFPADEAIYLLMNYPHIMTQLSDNAKILAKPDAAKNLGELIMDIYENNN